MGENPEERRRPDPEALLAAAGREGRGRLKIFLGAAPGVGKTYEMLTAGRARRLGGVDVVIGVVETHGRAETEALVEGFEVVRRRTLEYKGRTIDEMDLDALLARRPALALVDELAHTNAPGMRHPKRWQDVEELVASGIDVYTTLNVQHIESLNDVVAQITRIRVRETVPDGVLDRADDVEVIDLTPDDLIRRLNEGKVYVRITADRALKNYFSPGNLTALRELALRRTAQRVDDQLLTHMQAHAIAGPWAAGERVLVCVDERIGADGLVRYAKRLADRLRAPFTALTIETRRSAALPETARDRIAETLRLAERLGGEAATIPGGGRRLADDLLAYARETNATHLVVGKATRSRLFELLNGSVVHDLVRRAGPISVHVIAGEAQAEGGPERSIATAPDVARVRAGPYALALTAVGLALGVAWAVQPLVGVEAVDLILLSSVVVVAMRYGLAPSLAAVITASLAYNFFFLPPTFTFTVTDPTNVASLALFAVIAVLVSNLAARTRDQAVIARARARTTDALYGFSRKLAGCALVDDVLWATAFQMASLLKVRVVILLPEPGGQLAVRAGYPPEDTLEAADIAAAKVAFDGGRPAGRGSDTLPGARRLFLPMRTGRGTVAVAGLDGDGSGPLLTPEGARLFDALADQSALAIQQVLTLEDLERARLDAATDSLRQALLTSISHDLRTPLAAVIGSAGTLRDLGADLDEATRRDLLTTILDEGERLNRFIANLLDMTRLESGAVAPNLSVQEVGDLVGAALRRAGRVLASHGVEVQIPGDLPAIAVDPVLFEQVLFNLLDNAAKYANEGSRVRVEGVREGGDVVLRVLDEGPGIPPGDLERVFDKFHRVTKVDRVRAGTGLGLAICRGFIESMGGTIAAANRAGGPGTAFTVRLPAAPADRLRTIA